VIGRSIAIHVNADDGVTNPDGNAGQIVAFGTIGIQYVAIGDTNAATGVSSLKLVCNLQGIGSNTVAGQVLLSHKTGYTFAQMKATGLSVGLHGLHVHTFGDVSNAPASMGLHYNPTNEPHGLPCSPLRHVGDFGNAQADSNGNTLFQAKFILPEVAHFQTLIGRSCAVHQNSDQGSSFSPTGPVVAAGVWGVANSGAAMDTSGAFSPIDCTTRQVTPPVERMLPIMWKLLLCALLSCVVQSYAHCICYLVHLLFWIGGCR
jgi:Cu-Zn family superoxide dismutase